MAMNIYRLTGDMLHMLSKIILLAHLFRARNARGMFCVLFRRIFYLTTVVAGFPS